MTGRSCGSAGTFIVLVFLFVALFFGFLFLEFLFFLSSSGCIGFSVRIDQAIDVLVDLGFVVGNALAHGEDFGDGDRAGRDGHDHVLQAGFDALGDHDFAFARQQLDRAHFAHVHAHRVGRAAEFGVNRRQRGFSFFFSFLFRGHGRCVVVQEQRFGVRRLLVHGNADVVERGNQRFQRLHIDHVVGEVVVDFGVGQVAARFAQLDQRLELLAAGLKLFFRTALLRGSEFLEQGFFLGLAVTGLQLFGFRCRSGGGVKFFSHVRAAVVCLRLCLGLAAALLGLGCCLGAGRGRSCGGGLCLGGALGVFRGRLGWLGCGVGTSGTRLGCACAGRGLLALDFGCFRFRHGGCLALECDGSGCAARSGARAHRRRDLA